MGNVYKSEASYNGDKVEPHSPPEGEQELAALAVTSFNVIDHAKMAKCQAECEDVASHRQGKQAMGLLMSDFEFSPGVVLYCDLSNGKKARPLVPKPFRELIIKMMHALSHPGQKETVRRVAARYYWPKLKEDVSAFVKACKCQAVKVTQHTKIPPVHRPVPAKRFTQIMIDVIGPLPTSDKGLTHCLTILDRTSRFVQAIPMKGATAQAVCDAFCEGWVAHFGLCETAISDNGNTFISNLWTKLHEKFGSIVSYSPVYHAASLGHLERQHRDIKTGLRAALLEMGDTHGKNWPAILPWVLLGKRTAYQPDLGASPAELVYGQTLVVPGDLAGADLDADASTEDLLQRLRVNAARDPVQTSHHTTTPKQYFPANMDKCTHVWVKRPKLTPLGRRYDGPFKILEKQSQSCIIIAVGAYKDGKPRTELQHWENCKPAYFLDEPYEENRPNLGRPSAISAIFQ